MGPSTNGDGRTDDLRAVLAESVTRQDVREIAQRLLAKAKWGDVDAAELLLAYAVGRPAVSVELVMPGKPENMLVVVQDSDFFNRPAGEAGE